MAGFNDWIEIFEGGYQTDNSGRGKYYSDQELDRMVNSYDPRKDEIPIVVGHPDYEPQKKFPEEGKPAFGWVEGLRREGKKVLAKFKEVPEEFERVVRQGFWKKRSVSIRPDGTIKHVGFLGASHPAVKGLADIKFNEKENDLIYYFSENGGNEMAVNVEADPREKEIQDLKNTLAGLMEQQKEKDKEIQELKTQAVSSEFAEKSRQREEELSNLKAQVEKLEKEKRQKDYSDFCEYDLGAQLTPADRSFVVDLFDICHEKGDYNFSEGGKKDAVEKCKDFLKRNLKEHKLFGEVATKDRVVTSGKQTKTSRYSNYSNVNQEQLELHEKAKEYAEKNNVSYEIAVEKVRVK
jgi:hypothetical protein